MTDAAFQAAFDEYKDVVYRFAWRMCASAPVAEDVTQDVFLTLLRNDRFDPAKGSLRSFLLGIARNLVLKRWRDERRWDELDEDRLVTAPVDVGQAEIGEIVGRSVQSLPPLQREVVILAQYEELSLAEIAGLVGAEIGTVKSRLHRGRENLRRMLAPLRVNAHGTNERP